MSTVLWVIFAGAILSNLGVTPKDAPLYGQISGFAVPFALCVVLLSVNLADMRMAGKPAIAAFFLATFGTIVGALAAGMSLSPWIARFLGEESWKLAGPFTGTYIGGSLNFFAVWEGLEIGRPSLFAAANAVDNLALFPMFAVWMAFPLWAAGKWTISRRWEAPGIHDEPEAKAATRFVPSSIATLAFLALAVMAVSTWVKTNWVDPIEPSVPLILVVTTFALALGQVPAVRRLEGGWEIGDLCFWVFFAAVGSMIDFYEAVILSPILFLYVLIIISVHWVITFGGGRLLGMDPAVLTIASVATLAGPPLIPAVAHSRGWTHLALPGVVIGMLGYAIGNYVGFGTALLLKWLGG